MCAEALRISVLWRPLSPKPKKNCNTLASIFAETEGISTILGRPLVTSPLYVKKIACSLHNLTEGNSQNFARGNFEIFMDPPQDVHFLRNLWNFFSLASTRNFNTLVSTWHPFSLQPEEFHYFGVHLASIYAETYRISILGRPLVSPPFMFKKLLCKKER